MVLHFYPLFSKRQIFYFEAIGNYFLAIRKGWGWNILFSLFYFDNR